jgi:hypothetical protein
MATAPDVVAAGTMASPNAASRTVLLRTARIGRTVPRVPTAIIVPIAKAASIRMAATPANPNRVPMASATRHRRGIGRITPVPSLANSATITILAARRGTKGQTAINRTANILVPSRIRGTRMAAISR